MRSPKSLKLNDLSDKSYKILKTHPLGTYTLEMLTGHILPNLIHGNQLVKAHTFDANEF